MPPPPPPGPPGPPPPPSGKLAKLGGSAPTGNDRNALLKSIQQGKALKKTVTNDRSAPMVGGKASPAGGVGQGPPPARSSSNDLGSSSASAGRLPGIGGLFAGGMPTLKKTQGGVTTGRKPDASSSPVASATNLGPKSSAITPGYGTYRGPSLSGKTPQNVGDNSHQMSGKNYFNRTVSNTNSSNNGNTPYTSSSLNYSRSMSVEKYNFFMPGFLKSRNFDQHHNQQSVAPRLSSTPVKHSTPNKAPSLPKHNFNHQNSIGKANFTNGGPLHRTPSNPTNPKKPTLSRTSSVGKLVNNFETLDLNGHHQQEGSSNVAKQGFRGVTHLSYGKPPKPPPLTNSTPSLTPPSSSPVSSASNTIRKASNAPPPPPPAHSRVAVKHPNAKPPPPPTPQNNPGFTSSWGGGGGNQNPPPKPPHSTQHIQPTSRPALRAQSFNKPVENGKIQRTSKDDSQLHAPPPPVRTVSQSGGSNSLRRPGGPAPPPPPGGGRSSGVQRVAPLKPPTAPPPPPPTSHPPPPLHRTQPPPQPYSSQVKDTSNAPTPPARRTSVKNGSHQQSNSSGYNSSSSNSGGESFESRFAGRFKTPQFLPPPEPFTNCPKTYPSRTQPNPVARQGSMMKRAPAPPPPPISSHQQLQFDDRTLWAAQGTSRC